MTVEQYLRTRREDVDRALDAHLPDAATPPASIHAAMRYAVLGGGKRIRPILAIAAAEACGADPRNLMRPIAALELIHTYSLVHDDLPALDNDDLRRGRKTTHVVYGEALAILTGDALLTEAFSWLSSPIDHVPSHLQMAALHEVALAVDSKGMIGGQVADLEAERAQDGDATRDELIDLLKFIHANKTGRLITASVLLGGFLGGGDGSKMDALRRFGESIGLAFQIVDDLLDQEGTNESLGKTAGKDLVQGKLTWPGLLGTPAARQEVEALLNEAVRSADMIGGPVNYLAAIGRYICERRS